MSDNPFEDLASIEVQERYIAKGTRDEYLLPQELISNALDYIERVEQGRFCRGLNESQRTAVIEFGSVLRACLKKLNLNEIPRVELVRSNPEWALIRQAAQRVSAAFGDEADCQTPIT